LPNWGAFVGLQIIREKYWEYEYEEVVTPNLFNFDLWKRSGHADHYKDNMFLVNIEDQEFGLKPMNCPGTQARRYLSRGLWNALMTVHVESVLRGILSASGAVAHIHVKAVRLSYIFIDKFFLPVQAH
jgi:hypothetical protein